MKNSYKSTVFVKNRFVLVAKLVSPRTFNPKTWVRVPPGTQIAFVAKWLCYRPLSGLT